MASLVHYRAEALVNRDGSLFGYDHATSPDADGGLWDSGDVLWQSLNDGWGKDLWHALADSDRVGLRVLERSLEDVASSLWMIHPRSAIAELAQVVLAARRFEFREWLTGLDDGEGLQELARHGLIQRRWIEPAQSSDDESSSEDLARRSGELERGPIEIVPAGFHDLRERQPDESLGLVEAVEEFVNWRFCKNEVSEYWIQRNRLLAVSLGLGVDQFMAALMVRMTDRLPNRYWHPIHVVASDWSNEGWMEIPVSFPYADEHWGVGSPPGGATESFRMELISYLDAVLQTAVTRRRIKYRKTTLRSLWELGLPQERPRPPVRERPFDDEY